MDIKERNKQVKKVLSKLYGKDNVSVTGGKGSAHGWVNIYINGGNRLDTTELYSAREKEIMNNIEKICETNLKGIKFDTFGDNNSSRMSIHVNLH